MKNTNQRPLILVSNDDGITSKGLHTLAKIMLKLGDIVVVAPDSPQSGMGHAITLHEPLKLNKHPFHGLTEEAYACSGTPADCVKIAKHHLLQDRKPDLVVSGINHGSNTSVSVLYSGTMSAALEAAIENLPAIGFSLCDYDEQADFSHIEDYVYQITKKALENGLPPNIALNVNFPAKSEEAPKGVRICRQAKAKWVETFHERMSPNGQTYFWLSGHFENNDLDPETDEWAIHNNYVSIVPCQIDLTSYQNLDIFTKNWF